jgi:RimJ/RimL family protein N-acetyltransferase
MNFDFNADYTLEDEFVLLRPLKSSDYELLLDYSLHEPEIWKFNSGGAAGAENLKKYIDLALEARTAKTQYPFVVHDKKANKLVGSTRFYDISLTRNNLDIGFTWYSATTQGSGLNKNCKYLLLQFAFEKLNAERVGFRANNANERSKNAMKSIGCVEEGVMRSFGYDADGNRIDAIILSILKDEWFNTVQQNLQTKLLK